MDIVKQDLENQTATISIHVAQVDYVEKVESALKEQRKKAQMPGFRKGMVPAGLIKKMYGKHAQVEEINKLVYNGLYNYIESNHIQILGEPLLNEEQQKTIDWDNQTDFDFCFDIAIQPDVNIELNKKTKALYHTIIVDEQFVDKQVDAMTSRFGTNVEVDEVENEELITVDLTEVDEKGVAVVNGHKKEHAMLLLKVVPETERKAFIGKKSGDSFIFNPMKAINHEYEVISLLDVKHENTRELHASYNLEIKDIKQFRPAQVNQELFDSAFGEGEITSEQEFRDRIKADLAQRFAINSDYKFLDDFKKQLMETYPIVLPEDFLKRWLIVANKERNIAPDEVEKDLPHIFNDLRWELIKGHFVKLHNISISAEEFKAASREFTRMQFQQFGYYNPSEEDLDRWGLEIMKNKEESKKIADLELEKKLVAFFKDAIKLEQKAISLEDFNAMFEQ